MYLNMYLSINYWKTSGVQKSDISLKMHYIHLQICIIMEMIAFSFIAK